VCKIKKTLEIICGYGMFLQQLISNLSKFFSLSKQNLMLVVGLIKAIYYLDKMRLFKKIKLGVVENLLLQNERILYA
jgi:hypothetical protein